MSYKKNKLSFISKALISASLAMASSNAIAMEKCKIVGEDGEGLIKAGKNDCAGRTHSCTGHSVDGDPDAWILVEKGLCDKINAGDLSEVPDEIKDRIKVDKIKAKK